MGESVVLVTGASGEMGHLLVPALRAGGHEIVALDLVALPTELGSQCRESVVASILDSETVQDLVRKHRPSRVFHLAAVLSSKAEEDPCLAHQVNVRGTASLIGFCLEQATETGRSVRFLFPSSIAAYGLPDSGTKSSAGPVKETEWNAPSRMYGCNKLYCELLGSYFTERALSRGEPGLDFRSIRFPGLISAETVPSGGTSDYIPEMIHAAAQGKPYASFVRADTRLPFMTMPDAVEAFLRLADASPDPLSRRVYNIRAFSPSAEEFKDLVAETFPDVRVTFEPDPARQAIVDSWPADVDDSLARADWGFSPRHGLRTALAEYLLPALRTRYAEAGPAV
jgi:nucleoside-diphosphate-sugar epimerase